jgi:hypothetical protein
MPVDRERRQRNGACELTDTRNDGQSSRPADPRTAYDPTPVEGKWRRRWAETALYRTPEPAPGRAKFYCCNVMQSAHTGITLSGRTQLGDLPLLPILKTGMLFLDNP